MERGVLDDFCVAELPEQMMHAQPEAIRDRLVGQGGWGTVRSSLFEIAASQTTRYAWESALAWWGMTARLADASGVVGLVDRARALRESGDISLVTGRTAAALFRYQASLAIRDLLARADPGNADRQRDLSVCYRRRSGRARRSAGGAAELPRLTRNL